MSWTENNSKGRKDFLNDYQISCRLQSALVNKKSFGFNFISRDSLTNLDDHTRWKESTSIKSRNELKPKRLQGTAAAGVFGWLIGCLRDLFLTTKQRVNVISLKVFKLEQCSWRSLLRKSLRKFPVRYFNIRKVQKFFEVGVVH